MIYVMIVLIAIFLYPKHIHHVIASYVYRESSTQFDPERDDKRVHDERDRVSLVHRLGKEPQE